MTSVLIDIIGRDSASRAFDTAAASAARSARTIDGVSAKLAKTGAVMTRSVTVPFLAIAGASVKVATDFNSSMTRIQTQAGASAKDVKTLSSQVLNLSKSAQQGPVDLANALYHLKSVGLGNAQAMKALAVSSKLAAVGGADLEDTTNALAGAWRTGITGAKNFRTAAATVNAVIGAGNMTMTDFTDALSTGILPTAKTFGLTMKDVGSALALFTDEGVPANTAATRLRMSLSLLGAPSAKAEGQLESIGLTGLKLANDMRKPSGLIKAIGDLKSHLDASGMSASEQAQMLSHAFGGGRSSSAILSMVNNYSVLQKKQAQVTAGMSKFGAAVRAQAATPAAKFHQAIASLETAGVQLGNALLPDVVKLTRGVAGAVRWFDNLSPAVKNFLITAGGIAAIAGPVMLVGGAVGRLSKAFILSGLSAARFVGGLRQAEMSLTAMQSTSYAFGNKIGTAFANASGGVKKFSVALGGLAIGATIGEFTKNASSGAKAAGILGSAAAGAAMGMSAGPWGAAIGGAAGLLGSLATAFTGTSKAAEAAAAAEQTYASSVKASLNAMSKQNIAQTNANLASSKAFGLLDEMHKVNQAVGISYGDLTVAVNGSQKQFAAMTTQLKQYGLLGHWLIGALTTQRTGLGLALTAQKQYNTAQAQAADHAKIYARNLTSGGRAAALLGSEANGATVPIQHLSGTTKNLSNSFTSAWLAGKKLAAAIQNLGSNQMTAAQSEIQFQQDLAGLKSAWDKNSDAILGNSKAALQNRSALLGLLGDAKQHASDLEAEGRGARTVRRALLDQIGAIKAQALALGANKTQWRNLLAEMRLTPKDITTTLHTKIADALAGVKVVQQAISNINGTIVLHTKYANGSSTTGHAQFADGGAIRGPGTSRSDSIIARLSNGEHVMTADEVNKLGGQGAAYRMRGMIRRGMLKFADGGAITTVGTGTNKQWVYQGTKYSSLAEAEKAARSSLSGLIGGVGTLNGPSFTVSTQSQLSKILAQIRHARDVMHKDFKEGIIGKAAEKADEKHLDHLREYAKKQLAKVQEQARETAVAGIIGKIGQSNGPAFTIGQGLSYTKVAGQIAAAQKKLNEKIADGLSASAAKKYQAQIDKLKKLAQKELGKLRIKIEKPDMSAVSKALHGTVADARAAFSTMLADLRQSNASKSLISSVEADENRIVAKMNERAKVQTALANAQAKLAAAKQAYNSQKSAVSSAFKGSFDITTAGQTYNDQPATGASILAAVKKAVANAKTFTSVLQKLRKNGLSASLVAQLAEAGPAALPQAQALLSSGAGTLKAISKQYAELNKVSAGAGKYIADQTKGAGVQAAQGLVVGLKSKEAKLNKAIEDIADSMIKRLRKKLKVKSPSQVTREIGQQVAEGLIGGMTDRLAGVHAAAGSVASAAGGHHHHGGMLHSGALRPVAGVHIEHLEIKDQTDPVATSTAVTRRLAMLGAA